jgi:hypothetical protein
MADALGLQLGVGERPSGMVTLLMLAVLAVPNCVEPRSSSRSPSLCPPLGHAVRVMRLRIGPLDFEPLDASPLDKAMAFRVNDDDGASAVRLVAIY